MEPLSTREDDHCDVCGLNRVSPHGRQQTRVVAESTTMQELMKRVARFAPSDAPVAVLGETGTGKEVVARLLHQNSPRAAAPFVAVNTAALPLDLLESELFGHRRGAFTGADSSRRGLFEEAHGGTLLLDEMGEMPLALQAKLLRVLQDGEVRRVGENRPVAVDVRVMCATHRQLRDLVRQGTFREDLYFRLKVLEVHVPPLRERTADIMPIARQMLRQERRQLGGFSARASERLLGYSWPGNIRELHNVVRHGAALATGPDIEERDLPLELHESHTKPPVAVLPSPKGDSPGPLALADVEREHLLRVLELCEGSMTEAAALLQIGRNTLWRKLRQYGLR
jgi:two-component system response regulator HydG